MNKQLKEFKKNLILEKAQEHFIKYGYKGVQIDKLAKELEIGVGTIYSIFDSKEGLFLSWVFSIMEQAYCDIKTYYEQEKDPIKQCKYFISYKLEYYENKKSLLRDYMQNNQFFLKNTSRRKENPVKKIYELLCDPIEKIVKSHDKIKTDYLLYSYILDNILNGYIERFSEDENVDFTTKIQEIFDIFLSTLNIEGKINEV